MTQKIHLKKIYRWLLHMFSLLAECQISFVKNSLISWFIKKYNVNLQESSIKQVKDFVNFNDFFTRHLAEDIRPIDQAPNSIVSPVDGQISQFGRIESNRLLQAKGSYYSLKNLLANDDSLASIFSNGSFITLYLSPADYHRVHMPSAGHLEQMTYVPGSLYSVNERSQNKHPGLFTRNERVINVFETQTGKMCMILVGAGLVGSIETQWHGVITPPHSSRIQTWDYLHQAIDIEKGEEVGLFKLGSTVIVLFEKNKVQWLPTIGKGKSILMGSSIGRYQLKTSETV
jgi:phosphatidylserine decarboxylase